MSGNYYDVVVLGMDIGPLCAGALLARRGFRVLVVGQEFHGDFYPCCGYQFARRPFLLTGAHSPAIRRVMDELSLSQTLQRSFLDSKPRFQVVLPSARIDVFDDVARTAAEIAREIPQSSSNISVILKELGRLSSEFEKIISNDLVIPPESFFERRDFSRAEVQNPFFQSPDLDLFQQLGIDGVLRDFLSSPGRVETGDLPPSPLVQCRQIGAWLFDSVSMQGGRDTLRRMLCEKIVSQGGDLQQGTSVVGIDVHRGRARSVRMAGREEPTACQCILTDMSLDMLSLLISPTEWTGRFKALIEDDQAGEAVYGYGLNLGVDAEVIPEEMSDCVLLCPDPTEGTAPLRVERIPGQRSGRAALHVSCVVQQGAAERAASGELRDSILDRMRRLVPFLDHHLNIVHSVFDRSGPLCLRGTPDEDIPPPPRGGSELNWRVHRPERSSALGMGGNPYRTGIKGLYLSGAQVVSGLSTEGEFLAAWGAARIAGKMDSGRHRLLRSMRSSVEF